MPLIIRDFETMVDETLQRIVDANIGITNTIPGSVIRTIVEALMAELDIQNYTVDQIYKAMNIDTAEGSDLDNIVAILGVVRKQATYAEGTVVFGRSDVYATDIAIQYAQMISTRQNNNGSTSYEFMVTEDDAKLKAGELQTAVNVRATTPGSLFLPIGTITIMNTPIVGIEYVTNLTEFIGGTDKETDDELRGRAKQALAGLGKGTNTALRSALLGLEGVVDAIVMDANRGVGTADIVVITSELPPSQALASEIDYTIGITKAAGIDVKAIFPVIKTQNIVVTINDLSGNDLTDEDISRAYSAIINYCNSLSVGDVLIISQIERAIGNAVNDMDVDVIVTTPNTNVVPASTEVIRCGTVTINGVVREG